MRYEVFNLHDYFPQLIKYSQNFKPTLTSYVPSNSKEIDENRTRPTIIICPGGGYGMTSDREAEPIALSYVNMGFNAFVLRYSCSPAVWPTALLELCASICFVRNNAKEFNVKNDAIIVCGFSAGGHLAASLGVFWDDDVVKNVLNIDDEKNRPNGLILSYPVLSSGVYTHQGSIDNLLNTIKTDDLIAKMSLENQISEKTPPCFIWHTFNDPVVPIENSLLFANALREKNIEFELHIFPKGAHGLSLCDERTAYNNELFMNKHAKSWISLSEEWINLLFN